VRVEERKKAMECGEGVVCSECTQRERKVNKKLCTRTSSLMAELAFCRGRGRESEAKVQRKYASTRQQTHTNDHSPAGASVQRPWRWRRCRPGTYTQKKGREENTHLQVQARYIHGDGAVAAQELAGRRGVSATENRIARARNTRAIHNSASLATHLVRLERQVQQRVAVGRLVPAAQKQKKRGREEGCVSRGALAPQTIRS
jgi:hypothetical protein